MTSFEEIYTLNGGIQKEDYGDKPDNIYYFIMSNYLTFAIGAFCEYSYIDILDITPFEQKIYTFSTSDLETEFNLLPKPPIDSNFYVSVDNVKLKSSEFSYNSLSGDLTIPSGGGEVYIGAYVIGTFNNTLGIREKTILADAITEWFVEGSVNDRSQLQQIMYSGVEFYSQANHSTANLNLEKYRNSKSFKNMIMYTYSKNMPNTIKLGKRAGVEYE